MTIIILPNIIQYHIISFLNKNNFAFTLKYKNVKPILMQKPFFIYSYYKTISKYSYVCKSWFDYIQSLLFTQCCITRDSRMIDNIKEHQFSLYQFKNITHLYLSGLFNDDNKQTIDFIRKFSNLQRLIIKTNKIVLVKDIITNFPLLKVELHICEKIKSLCKDITLLDSIDRKSLEFIHVDALNIAEMFDNIHERYKRVNSIFWDYDRVYSDEYFPYSDIMSNKSLQHISIDLDCVWASDLIKAVKDNDHLISFRGSIPLSAFNWTEAVNNDGLLGSCSCVFNESVLEEFKNNNKMEHWMEFCQHLGTNHTLKILILKNQCRSHSLDYSSLRLDLQEQVSNAFCFALESNKTLEILSISSKFLTESFYPRFSANQTIRKLFLYNIYIIDLPSIGYLLKNNKTIKKMGISFERRYEDEEISLQEYADTFIVDLSYNQSLRRFHIYHWNLQKVEILIQSLKNAYKSGIEEDSSFIILNLNK